MGAESKFIALQFEVVERDVIKNEDLAEFIANQIGIDADALNFAGLVKSQG